MQQNQDAEHSSRSKTSHKLRMQNQKLHSQLKAIESHLNLLNESSPSQEQANCAALLAQISKQNILIRKLKSQLVHLKEEKDHIQYVVAEQNSLIVLHKELAHLKDELAVLGIFNSDKQRILSQNEPLIIHSSQVQGTLKQVIKLNHQSAVKIGELDRSIRKYHLQLNKATPTQDSFKEAPALSPKQQHMVPLQRMDKKWKPLMLGLDDEHEKLLKALGEKRQELEEREKQHQMWVTRMLVIREPQDVRRDRVRKSSVKPSVRLKKQLAELIKNQQAKQKEPEIALPDPFLRDKTEKLLERDDKNMSKLLDRNGRKAKLDKSQNTQVLEARNERQWERGEQRQGTPRRSEGQSSKDSEGKRRIIYKSTGQMTDQ